ncbi:MAG: transporter [Planctomycetaceae bacterium]
MTASSRCCRQSSRHRTGIIAVSIAAATWITVAPAALADDHPKKLLSYNGSEHDADGGEEGLYGDRIVTDRPHLAEAASTVGLGRIQVETGYTYYLDHSGGTTSRLHSFPETLVRAGLFQEWFEFRVQYNSFAESASATTGRFSAAGSDDLYLGAKVALAGQSGILPELTIFPQMKVPTGSPAYTADEVLPGMNFVYAWRVGERTEIECNTNVNRRRNPDASGFYTEYLQTFNFEYDLGPRVMLFNEFVIFAQAGGIGVPQQAYSHGGLHWFLLPNLQYDIHAAVGLNEAAADFFGGSGLSWRW